MKLVQKWGHTLLQWLFPRRCPLCGELIDNGETAHVCPACEEALSADLSVRCPVCHRKAPECLCTPVLIQNTMTNLGGRHAAAVGFYRPGVKDSPCNKLIYTLKSSTDDTAARLLARMLSRELLRLFLENGEDIRQWTITYPPRINRNKNENGIDQAQRLASFCAQDTGAVYASLFQRHAGNEQKSLSNRERMENAAGSLLLKNPDACRGKRIILCDDILTSGSTLSHCAALLREAGAADVFAAAVLVTIPKKRAKKPSSDMLWFQR